VQLQSASRKKKQGGKPRNRAVGMVIDRAKQEIDAKTRVAIDVVKSPGKWERLKEIALAKLPYHPQWLPAGTRFYPELQKPLDFGPAAIPISSLDHVGSQPPPDSVVYARLVTPLDSATTQKGASVEAIICQPLFSPDRQLILPEGSMLTGTVVQVQPARRFKRTGRLRYVFQRIEPPAGHIQNVEGSLEGAEVDSQAHLKVDAEGGTRTTESKWRYVVPAISVLLTTSAVHQDEADNGTVAANTGAQTGAGAVSLGLIGGVIGRFSRPFAVTAGFYGAALSVYSNFLARGREVVFPKNAALTVRFGAHKATDQKLD
jgi:hypothetical protein